VGEKESFKLSAPSLYEVACGIRDTCLQADQDNLEGYIGEHWEPEVPCVMVTLELDAFDRDSMDYSQEEKWRIWVVVGMSDMEEGTKLLMDYIDQSGSKSIFQALRASDAAWRDVNGLSDVSWYGFGRMPSMIQTIGPVDFGGGIFLAAPIVVQVRYGL
jgi:hypothetical protein